MSIFIANYKNGERNLPAIIFLSFAWLCVNASNLVKLIYDPCKYIVVVVECL